MHGNNPSTMKPVKPTPLADFLQYLEKSDHYSPQVVHHEVLSGQKPKYRDLAHPFPQSIANILVEQGIHRFYSHQARAVDNIRANNHTVIATPTASGKTLTYTLPVLERMQAKKTARALYLFPLKALAQDQLKNYNQLTHSLDDPPTAALYDGDTSTYKRKKIRENPPNIVISNPEMLHLSLLPHHHLWQSFLQNLEFVVVDEVHTYRGIMGSNMAWVFKRLRRVCDHYGADPTFVFCSATVGNPDELAQGLTGVEVQTVTKSGGPVGKRHIYFLNPLEGAARAAVSLLLEALPKNIRTIVYTQSRRMTELIAMWTAQRAGTLNNKISSYRAGFLPEERREIEAKLSTGELLGVISTSALELGIDIGALDLCLLVGYPGSVMSTWQRGGRVGRSMQESAVVLIGHEDALDQYFMQNPQRFFTLEPEKAVINPDNPVIQSRHLECAAADLPLRTSETWIAGKSVQESIRALEKEGKLLRTEDGSELISHRKQPHRDVDLRGVGRSLPIFESSSRRPIGDIDQFRACMEAHPGAVYLHRGQTYIIDELDFEQNMVLAHPEKVSYFTRAKQEKETEILSVEECKTVLGTRFCLGRLKVTSKVTGYERRLVKGQRLLGVVDLDLPPMTFETQGLWFLIPDRIRHRTEQAYMHFMGGIHALEHAAIGILPLLVLTDRNDLGGISIPLHPQVGCAAVFIYDGIPGGVGLSAQAYQLAEEVLSRTREIISSCECELGCPACVHSPKCGSGNRPIDKKAATFLINELSNSSSLAPEQRIPQEPPAPVHNPSPPGEITREDCPGSPEDADTLPDRQIHYGVLDIETRRSAQEVGGWNKAHKMGVSCAVLYDSARNDYLEFQEEDIPSLIGHLVEFDLVVGFNIQRFDYTVLKGYSKFDFWSLPTLDMLLEVKKRLGYRLSLDHLARATLKSKKTANGMLALKWWKEGKMDKIIEYCRQDVAITRDLYRFGRDNRYLLFQNKAKKIVRVCVNW